MASAAGFAAQVKSALNHAVLAVEADKRGDQLKAMDLYGRAEQALFRLAATSHKGKGNVRLAAKASEYAARAKMLKQRVVAPANGFAQQQPFGSSKPHATHMHTHAHAATPASNTRTAAHARLPRVSTKSTCTATTTTTSAATLTLEDVRSLRPDERIWLMEQVKRSNLRVDDALELAKGQRRGPRKSHGHAGRHEASGSPSSSTALSPSTTSPTITTTTIARRAASAEDISHDETSQDGDGKMSFEEFLLGAASSSELSGTSTESAVDRDAEERHRLATRPVPPLPTSRPDTSHYEVPMQGAPHEAPHEAPYEAPSKEQMVVYDAQQKPPVRAPPVSRRRCVVVPPRPQQPRTARSLPHTYEEVDVILAPPTGSRNGLAIEGAFYACGGASSSSEDSATDDANRGTRRSAAHIRARPPALPVAALYEGTVAATAAFAIATAAAPSDGGGGSDEPSMAVYDAVQLVAGRVVITPGHSAAAVALYDTASHTRAAPTGMHHLRQNRRKVRQTRRKLRKRRVLQDIEATAC